MAMQADRGGSQAHSGLEAEWAFTAAAAPAQRGAQRAGTLA